MIQPYRRDLNVKLFEFSIQPMKKGIVPPKAFDMQSKGGFVLSLIGGVEYNIPISIIEKPNKKTLTLMKR